MTIFFTGCTHFGHANIIRLAGRPFESVEAMDEAMVERWNAKVGPNDTVFHLGDIGWFRNADQVNRVFSRLNGRELHLVVGNHDSEATKACSHWSSVAAYAEIENCVLFHYPIEEWNGFYKGRLHLHCHTHQHDKKGKVHLLNRVNVTVEAWDYAPVALEEVRAVWAGRLPVAAEGFEDRRYRR